jgi:hypothetical protein
MSTGVRRFLEEVRTYRRYPRVYHLFRPRGAPGVAHVERLGVVPHATRGSYAGTMSLML